MARPNKMEKRPARLQCSKHDEHQYVDYSVPQVGLYVAKQEQVEPTWRIEQGTDLRCRVVSRSYRSLALYAALSFRELRKGEVRAEGRAR